MATSSRGPIPTSERPTSPVRLPAELAVWASASSRSNRSRPVAPQVTTDGYLVRIRNCSWRLPVTGSRASCVASTDSRFRQHRGLQLKRQARSSISTRWSKLPGGEPPPPGHWSKEPEAGESPSRVQQTCPHWPGHWRYLWSVSYTHLT